MSWDQVAKHASSCFKYYRRPTNIFSDKHIANLKKLIERLSTTSQAHKSKWKTTKIESAF